MATLTSVWSYSGAADQPLQLAPDVHADVLRNEIAGAVKANDQAAVISYIDEYKTLGVPFPPALLFVEAQAAEKVGDTSRALNALTAFMNSADRKSAQYKQAVGMYPVYATAAGAQRHSDATKNDDVAKAAAADAAKVRSDAESKSRAESEAKAAQARAIQERPAEIAKFVAAIRSELVPISGGKFQMGSYLEALKTSKPVHQVEVQPFKAARNAITCEQYKAFATLSATPSTSAWCDQVPKITWSQGQQLLVWLNQQSSVKFRMLSEAEWEWIAINRNGPAKVSVASNRELAQRDGLRFDVVFSTSTSQPEWLADCAHENYKKAPANSAAWTDAGDCSQRVMRGTSVVKRIEHRQFGLGSENLNFYTFDDAAFAHGRAFGASDQACGGKDQCSIRVAADE